MEGKYPGFEYVCRSAVMLTVKRSAGVSLNVNLKNSLQATEPYKNN